ncbi:5'-methylthioadenosine/S-adenosylhomocysteine nucleosidase family protein [Pseudomonas lini]
MIRILLTEDEQEKRRLITKELISTSGVTIDQIDVAVDVMEAKKLLKKKKYDLLILDLNLPSRAGEIAEKNSGLAILEFIKVNNAAIKPTYIIGMTAYEEAAAEAEVEFSSPLWKLVKFSFRDMAWATSLLAAVQYIVSSHAPPYICDGASYHTDLGIFVALDGEELSSILDIDIPWKKVTVAHDSLTYFTGTFKSDDKELSVVVAAAPKMGMPAAAVVTTKLISTFRPKYLAITGICAGVRKKVEMGDLLIADPSFDWGSGKWEKSGETVEFKPATYQWRLDQNLSASFKQFSSDPEIMRESHRNFDGKKPTQLPKVYIEAMASGAAVLQSQEHMDMIRKQHKNLIGIEMETYSVFTAAAYASDPKPICFSIKSVCDFGDDHKDDNYHEYAAYISARFLYKFALDKLEPVFERVTD